MNVRSPASCTQRLIVELQANGACWGGGRGFRYVLVQERHFAIGRPEGTRSVVLGEELLLSCGL